MRVCILGATNLRHMSLVSLYTSRLKEAGIKYDIIYMDKYGEEETNEAEHVYRFTNVIEPNWGTIRKVLRYFRFRGYATEILLRNNYDFIIVWNDIAIFMFADILAKHFSGKYCLNVRDDNHYSNPLLKRWYDQVFRHAAFRTVSSDGYREFLPPAYDYVLIHSLNESALKGLTPRVSLQAPGVPIRIGFIGNVRFFDVNKRLLDVFKNDPRFVLSFYGTNANRLKQYAIDNKIENVDFHDSFPVQDTATYLSRIDIMNNIYGNNNVNLRTALSIKLYHAVFLRIPILVSVGTYMEDISHKIGIGYTLNVYELNCKQQLYDWYRSIDFDVMRDGCLDYLAQVEKSRDQLNQLVNQYILS